MGDPSPSGAGRARWNDLGRRAASAAVLAPLALLCIWLGGAPFAVLMTAASIGLVLEWAALCRLGAGEPPALGLMACVLAAGGAAAAGHAGMGLALLGAGALALGAVTRRALLAGGVVYIGLAFVALLWLRAGADGWWDVLFVVLIVWASDIGAYMAGRLLGGPKLAPLLSPAKTWAGAGGGLVAAMLVGLALSGRPAAMPIAALLAVVCQAGDLLESAIKRHVGVKDSGRLIPGHGGLLDRLDGLMAAAPVAALVVLVGREGIFWR